MKKKSSDICTRCEDTVERTSRRKRKYCNNCLVDVKQEIRLSAARSDKHREAARQVGLANRGKQVGAAGPRHHLWKGDAVGIDALHSWVKRHKPDPKFCEHCGTNNLKLEWANKSQEYKRALSDWLRLCRSCHLRYDNKAGVRNGSKKAVFSGIL